MRLTISASASASRSPAPGSRLTSALPGLEVELALRRPGRARVQGDHAARHGRDHEEREPDRDLERRPLLVGEREVVEPDRAVADGRNSASPERTAQQSRRPRIRRSSRCSRWRCGGERERAQLALLVGERRPARRAASGGVSGRSGGGPSPGSPGDGPKGAGPLVGVMRRLPPSLRRRPRAATAPARAGVPPRSRSGPPAAGRSRARTTGSAACRR